MSSVLKKRLSYYSNNLLFEKAELIKNQLFSLEKIKHKSTVVSIKKINIDSFYLIKINNYVYINFIRVVEGSIIYLKNSKVLNSENWEISFVLESYIKNIFINYDFLSNEIISNIELPSFLKKRIFVPKRGYKKNILNLGYSNLINYINNNSGVFFNILKTLKKDLFLKKTPFHIECFDISTLHGNNTVASCVVFKNGKAVKEEYKHYNINTISGKPDDYFFKASFIEK